MDGCSRRHVTEGADSGAPGTRSSTGRVVHLRRTVPRVRRRRHQPGRPDAAGSPAPSEPADTPLPTPTPGLHLSYSASSDVALLSLQDPLEFSQVAFVESPDVFVVTKDGRVVGVLLLRAGELFGHDRLTECENLDVLSLPRLGDEPF